VTVSPVPYDDLVTTATVGLSRRPLPDTASGMQGDEADILLDLAARHAVARRAGMLVPRGMAVPPPMAPDPAPELPARAAEVLRRVISDHELLADLLTAAAGAGCRAPAPLLPALLDAAVRTVALRAPVSATLGTRGRWLAARRAEWDRIVAVDSAGPTADDPRSWETGTRAERIAYLSALRDHDPLAARALLAAGWARESARERESLLPVLARNLSADDEAFLEAALDDSVSAVRIAARRLLGRLEGSALNCRAATRAAHVLRLRSDGRHRWLQATLMDPGDLPDGADLQRDGIAAASPLGTGMIGGRPLLLTRLVAAVPLAEWGARWSLSPAQIVSLDIRDSPRAQPDAPEGPAAAERNLTAEVHAGWRLAAASQANAEWAKAILTGPAPLLAPDRQPSDWPPNHVLAGLLDPATRAALAADVFTRIWREAQPGGGSAGRGNAKAVTAAMDELARWPGPWPPAAADYVMSMLASGITTQRAARVLQGLLASAARHVPVTGPRDYPAELIRLTHRPDCSFPWLNPLRRAADTITLRRAFAEALSALSVS